MFGFSFYGFSFSWLHRRVCRYRDHKTWNDNRNKQEYPKEINLMMIQDWHSLSVLIYNLCQNLRQTEMETGRDNRFLFLLVVATSLKKIGFCQQKQIKSMKYLFLFLFPSLLHLPIVWFSRYARKARMWGGAYFIYTTHMCWTVMLPPLWCSFKSTPAI